MVRARDAVEKVMASPLPLAPSQFVGVHRLDVGTGNLTTVVDLNTVPDASGRVVPALQVLAGMP